SGIFWHQLSNIILCAFKIGNSKLTFVKHIAAHTAYNKLVKLCKHLTVAYIHRRFLTGIVNKNLIVFKNNTILIRFGILPHKHTRVLEVHFTRCFYILGKKIHMLVLNKIGGKGLCAFSYIVYRAFKRCDLCSSHFLFLSSYSKS